MYTKDLVKYLASKGNCLFFYALLFHNLSYPIYLQSNRACLPYVDVCLMSVCVCTPLWVCVALHESWEVTEGLFSWNTHLCPSRWGKRKCILGSWDQRNTKLVFVSATFGTAFNISLNWHWAEKRSDRKQKTLQEHVHTQYVDKKESKSKLVVNLYFRHLGTALAKM